MSSHKEPLNNIYHVGLSDVKIAILAVCSWTSNYTYTHIHVHTHAGVLAQSDTSPALTPPSYLLSTGCGSLSHAILSHNPPSFIVCLVNKGEVQWLPVTPHSLPFAISLYFSYLFSSQGSCAGPVRGAHLLPTLQVDPQLPKKTAPRVQLAGCAAWLPLLLPTLIMRTWPSI